MPLVSRIDGQGDTLFLRITDFAPAAATEEGFATTVDDSIVFTLVTLKKRVGVWSQKVQSTPLRALQKNTLEAELATAGFSSVHMYGNYDFAPFNSLGTNDLVAIAVK
jgi:hypothetical protein